MGRSRTRCRTRSIEVCCRRLDAAVPPPCRTDVQFWYVSLSCQPPYVALLAGGARVLFLPVSPIFSRVRFFWHMMSYVEKSSLSLFVIGGFAARNSRVIFCCRFSLFVHARTHSFRSCTDTDMTLE